MGAPTPRPSFPTIVVTDCGYTGEVEGIFDTHMVNPATSWGSSSRVHRVLPRPLVASVRGEAEKYLASCDNDHVR
jgi:hypothetical protein